jgi:hypothetical protein
MKTKTEICSLILLMVIISGIVVVTNWLPKGPPPDTSFWLTIDGRKVGPNTSMTITPDKAYWHWDDTASAMVVKLTVNPTAAIDHVTIEQLDPGSHKVLLNDRMDHLECANFILGQGVRRVSFYNRSQLVSRSTFVIHPTP